jgi:hypothetical protein
MNTCKRSLAVVVLVPLLVCCTSSRYAFMRTSRAEDSACFQACRRASSDDRRAFVSCVARCPGATTGDGECNDLDVRGDDACVDVPHVDGGKVVWASMGILVGLAFIGIIALDILIPRGFG